VSSAQDGDVLDLRSGFTLIELMVVIIILGILATIVMPRVLDLPVQARRRAAAAQIAILKAALERYAVDTGEYPATGQGLKALVGDPGAKGWGGPYLQDGRVPEDPWGNAYVYVGQAREFEIICYGADGQSGGSEAGADISSKNLSAE
jgi:general secretion pathway protein G